MTRVLDGKCGILSGLDLDDPGRHARAEAERRKAEAEAALIATREAKIDAIENKLLPTLRGAIFEEIESRKSKEETIRQHVAEVKRFKAYCAEHKLQVLPADPWVVAAHLWMHFEEGYKRLRRICAAIAWYHKQSQEADPTTSVPVQGLLRYAKSQADKEPPQPKED